MSVLSIKAGVAALLNAAAITPYVYHRELPQNPSYPATVYLVVSDIPIGRTHDARNTFVSPPIAGAVLMRRARVQIDVYAQTVEAAEDAMERYVQQFGNFMGPTGAADFPDVSVWYDGANPDKDFEEEPTLAAIEGRSRDFMILY